MFQRIALVSVLGLSGLGLMGCQKLVMPRIYEAASDPVFAPEYASDTPQKQLLRTLPAPQRRITVSVYEMPDLSGQYKESATGQTLSRAVTQGGADVLIKSLLDAGGRSWFNVLDRAALDNLLKERQIITEMRRLYRSEAEIDPAVLGPLDHAGILIQGAIVGYDSNTMTGGLGAQYLGIGANRKYKLDVATVGLRAIATETGEVLASVVVRKPIASISSQGNVFRFVALDELLESELGVAMNEPRQMAIEAATEKAVLALIAEGVEAGLWSFKDKAVGAAFIREHHIEKYGTDAGVGQGAAPQSRATISIPRTVPTEPPEAEPIVQQLEPNKEDAAPTVDPDSDEVLG